MVKSVYGNIITELHLDNAEKYRRYLRMNTATFEVSYYHNFPFISCVRFVFQIRRVAALEFYEYASVRHEGFMSTLLYVMKVL